MLDPILLQTPCLWPSICPAPCRDKCLSINTFLSTTKPSMQIMACSTDHRHSSVSYSPAHASQEHLCSFSPLFECILNLNVSQRQCGTSQEIEKVTRGATQPKEVLDLQLDPEIQLKWLLHPLASEINLLTPDWEITPCKLPAGEMSLAGADNTPTPASPLITERPRDAEKAVLEVCQVFQELTLHWKRIRASKEFCQD